VQAKGSAIRTHAASFQTIAAMRVGPIGQPSMQFATYDKTTITI
jgi:hypothetical protein